jgi:signal transduction histidine kinase
VFEIAPMIEVAVRETRLHAGTVRLRVEVEPQTLALDGDAERLHQVVANLVENAVRHSPADGEVFVRATAAGPDVRIEVTDEGPGIPASEATRVFERFYRADNARSSDQGGAGLGLAIARWIVDLHDGEVHVESRQPHGACMVVTLPRRVDPAAGARNEATRSQHTHKSEPGERSSVLASTQPTEKGR